MSATTTTPASPAIPFIFRYRDLVAPTLAEHRKLIRAKQKCWWGWWKRPSEPARKEVWDQLETLLKDGPVRIGLYDSGSNQVYGASLKAIIAPTVDASGHCLPVSVPSGEDILIPEYYRSSPFSRAWLLLTAIDEEPLPFFMYYSFSDAPPLPNYPELLRKMFVGKVILDSDELRGMDATIWSVRLRLKEDKEDRIIVPPAGAIEPLSGRTIALTSETILHITDLHYAVDSNRSEHVWKLEGGSGNKATLAEAIYTALKGKKIGAVLITGDLTYRGSDEEYTEALKSISRLLGNLDLWHEHVVVIPGNHDIVWTSSNKYNPKSPVETAPEEATENYKKFYESLLRHKPNNHLSIGRRFILPNGITLEIGGLNSSSLEQGKKFLAGMGRIQEQAFMEVANSFGWTPDSNSMVLRLLALHHHLTPTENLEEYEEYYKGFGMAVDAPRIQRLAARNGVQLVLHGHKHRVFVWNSGVYELPEHTNPEWSLGQLAILGGGSAGSKATEGNKNYFNLLNIKANGVEVEMYRSENTGAFTSMAHWHSSFSLGAPPAVLRMSDWKKAPLGR